MLSLAHKQLKACMYHILTHMYTEAIIDVRASMSIHTHAHIPHAFTVA